MKRFHSFVLALLTGAALASCSSERYFQFAAHSTAYRRLPVTATAPAPETTPALAAEVPVHAAEPSLTASAAPNVTPAMAPVSVRAAAPAAPKLAEQRTTARAEHQLTRAQERRFERILRKVRKVEARQEAAGQQVDAAELILAILIPPVGVLLHEHGLNSKFWISLLLTLLFFIPGMIYAILVVTDTI